MKKVENRSRLTEENLMKTCNALHELLQIRERQLAFATRERELQAIIGNYDYSPL